MTPITSQQLLDAFQSISDDYRAAHGYRPTHVEMRRHLEDQIEAEAARESARESGKFVQVKTAMFAPMRTFELAAGTAKVGDLVTVPSPAKSGSPRVVRVLAIGRPAYEPAELQKAVLIDSKYRERLEAALHIPHYSPENV